MRKRPKHVSLTPAKAETLYGVPAEHYPYLCGIPGYDPFRGLDPKVHYYDAARAQRHLDFFPECLTHIDGELAGKAFVLASWQEAVVACIFGWWRRTPAGPRRRYRKGLIYVGKKNGKTTFLAGLGVEFLFLDGEAGAQVYSAGASKDQAAYAWLAAARMVDAEPELRDRSKIYGLQGGGQQRSIHFVEPNSAYKIIASDSKSQDGFKPHAALVDEVHRFNDGEFIDLISRSQIASPNGITLQSSTADYERISPCNTVHDYAVKVRDGTILDVEFLPVVYEADKDDDWRAIETWKKANPGLGHTFHWEDCVRLIKEVEAQPSALNTLKRLNLNIVTKQISQAFDMEEWDDCAGPVGWKELPETMRGRECFIGLDLSSRRDLTALVCIFPKEPEGDEEKPSFDVVPFFFHPQDNAMEREKSDHVPYTHWADEGAIELTPGNMIDFRVVRKRANELRDRYGFRDAILGVDRHVATMLETYFTEEDGFKLKEVPMSMRGISEPSKDLDAIVPAGLIRHGGHPLLGWCASNCAKKMDHNENMRYVKGQSDANRIDGIIALVIAIACHREAEPVEKGGGFFGLG